MSWRLRSSGADRLVPRPVDVLLGAWPVMPGLRAASLIAASGFTTGVVALCRGVRAESLTGRRGSLAAAGTGSSTFGVWAESLARSLGVCRDESGSPVGTGVLAEFCRLMATSGVCDDGLAVSEARGMVTVRSGVFCEAGDSFDVSAGLAAGGLGLASIVPTVPAVASLVALAAVDASAAPVAAGLLATTGSLALGDGALSEAGASAGLAAADLGTATALADASATTGAALTAGSGAAGLAAACGATTVGAAVAAATEVDATAV